MSRARSTLTIPLVGALIVACNPNADKPRELQTVKVARSAFLTNAPIFVGEDAGYFAREGIRLEFVDLASTSVQSLPALDRGDVDVVSGAVAIGFFNAVAAGTDVRIVADRGHFEPLGCESFGIVGRKSLFGDRPLDAAQLRGRKFAVNELGQTGYLASRFLNKYGLDLSDIKVVRIPATAERHALDAGTIDVVARGDPFFFHLMEGGHRLLAGGNAVAPGSHLAVLEFGPTLLRRNPGLGHRFMVAYLRSVRKYNEGPTAGNLSAIGRGLGIDTADLRRMCWPATRADGAVNMRSLIDYQEWGRRIGQISRILDATEIADPTFARRAAQVLDAEIKRR
jgi:ABC-type nitrate/sulfonate/bicarbonate transport system substrate-binding protein